MNYLKHIGKYFMMLGQVFKRPQKGRVFKEALFKEFDELGIKSIGIVIFISFFIGGVIALQTALNIENPLIPKYLVSFFLSILWLFLAPNLAINVVIGTNIKNAGILIKPTLNGKFAFK